MIDIRHCNNLELMAEIPDNTIDLIYSDILYGTGRNFGEYQDLKPKQDVIERHYLLRLIEMKRVLKQNGSIYLQMDTKINHWMRIMMDDVFGYNNFKNEIIWEYGLGRSSDKQFGKRHDVILWYSCSGNYTYNKQLTKATSNRMKGKYKNMGDVWTDIPSLNNMAKERLDYSTQKPKELIKRIIKASSNKEDLVADFYAGSFTTAEVCKDLNRNFIGCDVEKKAFEIGKKRLKGKTPQCN